MLLAVRQESQTCDEAYNLLAGYLELTAGDFSICPAYPPLTKEVAALPFLVLRPRVPPMSTDEAGDFRGGHIFLYANPAERLLFAAHVAMTVFPLLLALLVFLAGREMFGPGPAMLALVLVAFEPNLLAHGPLATNDVALAAGLFAAVYAFWRYVVNPNAWRLAAGGVAAALALAAKHSGLIVFPILFLLALVEYFTASGAPPASGTTQNPHGRLRLALRLALALMAVAGISIAVLWGFYNFRYAARPGAGEPLPSLARIMGAGSGRPLAAALAWAARLHLLPEAFLEGLIFFLASESRPTYLLGTYYLHGVWFYFPTAAAIKSTLGFLLLLALAPFVRLLRAREVRRETLWMLVPAFVFLAASMSSNLNIGLRHILPVYPFLMIWAAAGAWGLAKASRAGRLVVGGLVLAHVASSLAAFPNYLSYSNELWGGPQKTYRVLTDSNVDWGQGLPAIQRYLRTHAATPCWLAYFGSVDPAYYGIPCTLLPVHLAVVWERPLEEIPATVEGTVLVSATEMSGQTWGPGELNPYEQFRLARPLACLAGSILVYRGSFQVPLASALSHLGKVNALADRGEYDAALAEVHTAEALAPQSVDVEFVRGRVLKAAGRNQEARRAFEKALNLALTIHPESQTYWIPVIQGELGRP